jgi:hypothetical protein
MGAEVYCPPSVGVVNQYSNPHWILTLSDYSRSFRCLLGELTFNSQKKLSRFAVNTPKVILQCKATRDFEKRDTSSHNCDIKYCEQDNVVKNVAA